MARTADVRVFPHTGGLTVVGQAANLHFASLVDDMILEFSGIPSQPVRVEILRDPISDHGHVKDGTLPVPDGRWLGIKIDESKFEAYPYRPSKIHPDIYPTTGTL